MLGPKAAGKVPPAPEMLRTLATQGERHMDANELAASLGKKATGGHWNSGMAVLRDNGLIKADATGWLSSSENNPRRKPSGRGPAAEFRGVFSFE